MLVLLSLLSLEPSEKPRILVTIPPYEYIVESISEGFVDVESVVNVHGDCHSYAPSISEVARINGDLWIRTGEPIEKIISERFSIPHMDITTEHHRHLWLSIPELINQCRMIEKALSDILPGKSDLFKKNSERLVHMLSEVDKHIENITRSLDGKSIINLDGYYDSFCERYNLSQIKLGCGKLSSLKKVLNLVNIAIADKPICVISRGMDEKSDLISLRVGISQYEVNPYEKNVFNTFDRISKALEGSN